MARSAVQKKGLGVGKTKRGKDSKIMAVADTQSLPVAVCVTSASSHEVTLVEETLESTFIDEAPEKLIGDKAYDSGPLGEQLYEERSIELVTPHTRESS